MAKSCCFHCGLEIPQGQHYTSVIVFSQPRDFCCGGCSAVCESIVSSGFEDYYQHRTQDAISASQKRVPNFLDSLTLYDRQEIQKTFVIECDNYLEAELLLEDIRCPACLWLNEKHLRQLPGVLDVNIDDLSYRARVRWNPGITKLSEILKAITYIGYKAYPFDAENSRKLTQERNQRSFQRVLFAGIIGMPVMQFAIASYVMGGVQSHGQLELWEILGRWSSLLLCLILLAYPGQAFFVGAWTDLKNRRLAMDVPIVLGLMAALLGSVYATIVQHGEVYYDSIAMFVFFVLLSRRWELKGKLRAFLHIDRVTNSVPAVVMRRTHQNTVETVAVADLRVADELQILPGAVLPVDAKLISGSSAFDESLLTGEPMPVMRHCGDEVIAGSVNTEQAVWVSVTQVGEQCTLNQAQRMVRQALNQKPKLALLADRIARDFVFLVLLLSFATGLYWYWQDASQALANTIAVLMVTCPCALALATPVALTVSAGKMLEMGILPVNMRAIELLAQVDTFAFDKTGTLTSGKPELKEHWLLSSLSLDETLPVARSLANHSEHILAKALQSHSSQVTLNLATAVENFPGLGIQASIAGKLWRLGSLDFCEWDKRQHPLAELWLQGHYEEGDNVSALSVDGQAVLLLAFSDCLKPTSLDAIVALREQFGDDHIHLLSGDQLPRVQQLAQSLGITSYQARLEPADKLKAVRALQGQGRRVLMVGDGVNDGPVLAGADVSMSFANATDLAQVNSDFVLMNNDLSMLLKIQTLAKRTHNTIIQNFLWAAGYNLLAIPLAATGQIPPWGAAIGMSLSSLIVVLNALRLSK